MSRTIATKAINGATEVVAEEFEASIDLFSKVLRAFEILDRLGRQQQPTPNPLSPQHSRRAELRLSRRGDILSASPLATVMARGARSSAMVLSSSWTVVSVDLATSSSGSAFSLSSSDACAALPSPTVIIGFRRRVHRARAS